MKKLIIIITAVIILALAATYAIPALAQGFGERAATDNETWAAMYEACEAGDWEAMEEAAEEVHQDLDFPPCHDEYVTADGETSGSSGYWGGHMGGGMMGGNWGGQGGGVPGGGWGGMMSW